MAVITSYYNSTRNRIEPVTYTWADLTGGNTWASLDTWEDATGAYTPAPGDVIRYTSDIIDQNTVDYRLPTVTVGTNRTVNIKIYASEQIDSSSQISGAPVITGSQNQTLSGVRARYFQIEIDVDNSQGDAFIDSIGYAFVTDRITETVIADSATHDGTTSERIMPLENNYSVITKFQGTAFYDGTGEDSAGPPLVTGGLYVAAGYVAVGYVSATTDFGDPSEIPVVVIRSLADATQPKYAVFTTNGTNRDHQVCLTVEGLPLLRSDSTGNLVLA